MNGQSLSIILTLSACFLLMCRIDKMIHGVTKKTVFVQHAALAMGMFGSVILDFTAYAEWSNASMAIGVLSFFFFSIGRWRRGAPDGTTRPIELSNEDFIRVHGGNK